MTDIYLCIIVDVTYGEKFLVDPVTFFDTIFFGSSTVHKEGHKCRICARSFLLGSQQNSLLDIYCFYTPHGSSRISLLLLYQ